MAAVNLGIWHGRAWVRSTHVLPIPPAADVSRDGWQTRIAVERRKMRSTKKSDSGSVLNGLSVLTALITSGRRELENVPGKRNQKDPGPPAGARFFTS